MMTGQLCMFRPSPGEVLMRDEEQLVFAEVLSHTPLRYPGGKRKVARQLRSYLPRSLDRLVAPFLGGAGLEILLANEGVAVAGSDSFFPLVNFWHYALHCPEQLAQAAQRHYPFTIPAFYQLQRTFYDQPRGLEQAAAFYALNRASFSGSTLSGGYSENTSRFSTSSLRKLAAFRCPNLTVRQGDYQEALEAHPHTFAYLDPPYVTTNNHLYGYRGSHHLRFNHQRLAEALRERQGWAMSYQDSPEARRTYDFARIIPLEWNYGMTQDRHKGQELLILRD